MASHAADTPRQTDDFLRQSQLAHHHDPRTLGDNHQNGTGYDENEFMSHRENGEMLTQRNIIMNQNLMSGAGGERGEGGFGAHNGQGGQDDHRHHNGSSMNEHHYSKNFSHRSLNSQGHSNNQYESLPDGTNGGQFQRGLSLEYGKTIKLLRFVMVLKK